jgi:DNA-binding MarR family transcriptional regulator
MPGDLTPSQYAVLATVAEHEGLSHARLIERTGIGRSTVSDIVRRLRKKGLLQRRRKRNDARAYAVKLTDEGWLTLSAAQPIMQRVDQRILETLPLSYRRQFLDDLTDIIMSSASSNRDGT